jgi:hypothetical protein
LNLRADGFIDQRRGNVRSLVGEAFIQVLLEAEFVILALDRQVVATLRQGVECRFDIAQVQLWTPNRQPDFGNGCLSSRGAAVCRVTRSK